MRGGIHIVVLMLENRSFDHMLGFLYEGKTTPSGEPFEGLTGGESNADASGNEVTVFKIDPAKPSAYFMPGCNPGEGYSATNLQLFGADPEPNPPTSTNGGFVTNFAATLKLNSDRHRPIVPGTVPADIMGIFTPEMLPVLSGLARGYAVCDRWYCSVPTETIPNRAFACAATSQGHMNDLTKSFTVPTIFGLLTGKGVRWKIYGYDKDPLARLDFPDTTGAPDANFGLFRDFQADAQGGQLPAYAFLEPGWGPTGNSQHPAYDVAKGEQLIHDVYRALRDGPGWNQTLLIVTYDEHAAMTMSRRQPVPFPPTGRSANTDSTSRASASGSRPCWSRRLSLPASLPCPHGVHAAGPHVHTQDGRDALGATQPHGQGRRRQRHSRRSYPGHTAGRRSAR